MTISELVKLKCQVRKEIKFNRFTFGSVPKSLQDLVKEIERELLIRGYAPDSSMYNPLPVEVLANALQDTVHKPYFGKARAGKSVKVSKI